MQSFTVKYKDHQYGEFRYLIGYEDVDLSVTDIRLLIVQLTEGRTNFDPKKYDLVFEDSSELAIKPVAKQHYKFKKGIRGKAVEIIL